MSEHKRSKAKESKTLNWVLKKILPSGDKGDAERAGKGNLPGSLDDTLAAVKKRKKHVGDQLKKIQ